MAKGLHLIYLYADSANEWNCSQWRALSPSDCINAEHAAGRTTMTAKLFYMPSALNWRHPEVTRKIGEGDVLIFQRNVIVQDVWQAMDYGARWVAPSSSIWTMATRCCRRVTRPTRTGFSTKSGWSLTRPMLWLRDCDTLTR